MKFRLLRPGSVDELRDAFHLFFALGDQPFQTRAVIEHAGLGLLVHEIDHLGEDR